MKDKAARKKNDEMQEAWRKKNDDFIKSAKKKKNKKETRRLKMRLHDNTIKGILSQTLFCKGNERKTKGLSLKRKSGRK